MKRNRLTTVVALGTGLSIAGCGGHQVANPFARGISGGVVVANDVICQPTPSTCARYVVVDPSAGTSQAALIRTAEALVELKLGWRRSNVAPVPPTEGVAFDGPTSTEGAFVNTSTAELVLDSGELGTGTSATGGRRLLGVMRAHPSAVVVRIINAR